MQAPAFEASIKLCLQWLGPDSLPDAWPGSDPLIRLVRGCFLQWLPFKPQVWLLGRYPFLLRVTFWRFLPPELIVIPSPAASAPFGTKPDLMFSVVMLLGNQPLPSLLKIDTSPPPTPLPYKLRMSRGSDFLQSCRFVATVTILLFSVDAWRW